MFERIESFAQGIVNAYWKHQKERWEHESESIRLGLITDEEKLKILKEYLFSRVHGDRDISNLIQAIATLENSIQAKYQRDNDFIGKLNEIVNSSIVLLFLATSISYFALGACGDSKKPICSSSTQIARYFNKQFSEPK